MYNFLTRRNAPITLALGLIASLSLFGVSYADDTAVSSGQFTGMNEQFSVGLAVAPLK